ncbi:sushi, von Willebrand factor type A, EGF and pentraxin domain-containing protein 1-like [Lytechinus pictus]|uniref:sushi, von Willebrand factor type A, EGF and pentraxin domain-containing protein 1-like n=1 Tax=Lytechinus pictus TaxID=7653 RepID=UPI0030BA211E
MSLCGSKLSQTTPVFILLILSGLVLTVAGQICGTLCSPPAVLGGGSISFSPNETCYDEGSSVNVTCSGYLFGETEIGECFNGYWETPQQPTCEESSCPVPTDPQNGSLSPSGSNSLYDEIEYSCNEGLFLDGPSMAVCTGTGQWSPNTIPSCSGNCTIPVIANGQGTSSDDVLQEGSQLTITCSEGYSLIGIANVTCHSEEWNPAVGECLANCPSPDVANSDFATNQGEINHGDYIILTCDEGFTSGTGENVSEPLTCGNGTWDTNVYCYANCPSISSPDDGYANSLVEPFYHGRIVTFNCSTGFTLVGDSNSTCNDGNWTNAVPECKADCLVPYIGNSNLNDTTNSTYVPHGSSTMVTCYDGFTFGFRSDFDGNLACDDGVIDSSGIACLENCASPTVRNSNWANQTDVFPYGASLVVECDDGFSSGSGSLQNETLVCEGGSWNDSVNCYENCPTISAPDGGNMYPDSASFYHSNSVYFNCSETYLFVGQPNLTCDSGTWSDPVPDCKASCVGPDVENSDFTDSTDLTQHGSFVEVQCNDGFTSGAGDEAEEVVYCDDGSFNRTVYCYENCPNITGIENGIVELSGPPHFYGDSVNFTCLTNYTLDGNQTVTCLDGEWSSSFPECKADCRDPGTPVNGSQVANSSYSHGGQVSFECDAGFDILGSETITCDNGTWSGLVPICAESTLVDQITLTCAYDSFTVQVPYALLDGLTPEQLVLENDVNCTGVNDSSGVVNITSKLGDCGTELIEETDTDGVETTYYDTYKNRVIAYSPTGLLSGPQVNLPLTCTYDRERLLDGVKYQLNNYTISRSLAEDGTYQFLFAVYEDENFDTVVDDSVVYVDLGEDVFFGVSLMGAGGTLRVNAQTCWATPSFQSTDSIRWELVANGCPNDDAFLFYEDATRALFSLSSFRFLNKGDSVYIHCDVLVCELSNSQCNNPWEDCAGSNSRRRRRSAAHIGPTKKKRLRVGPFRRLESSYSYSRHILPDSSQHAGLPPSVAGSPTAYIVIIVSLAAVCLVLIASLSFVTTKLLMARTK